MSLTHGCWRVARVNTGVSGLGLAKEGRIILHSEAKLFLQTAEAVYSAMTNVALFGPRARRRVSAGGRRAKPAQRDGIRAEMHLVISSFPLQEHRNGPNLPGICMRPSVRGLEGGPKCSVTAPLGTKPALQRETGGCGEA